MTTKLEEISLTQAPVGACNDVRLFLLACVVRPGAEHDS